MRNSASAALVQISSLESAAAYDKVILNDHLDSLINQFHPDGSDTFQDDNTPSIWHKGSQYGLMKYAN